MGRHAEPGLGRFTKELTSFALRLLVVAIVFFGAVWLLVTQLPEWLGGDDGEATATTAPSSTQPTVPGTSSVLDTRITAPPTTTTFPLTSTLPPTTTTTAPAERAPADVVVLVLNSTNRSGLAASATARLDELGYQTLEPDNSTPTLSASQVLFAPTFSLEAYTLAAQFPDGEVLPNPDADPPADIVVILGTSYAP